MSFFSDRRVLLFGGAGLALLMGLGLAWIILVRSPAPTSPPAARGGLIVQSGRDDDLKLDPKRPLRCFVGGQFVGEMPLAACAQRNGVATGSLDVGLDQSGALAASNGAPAGITPLPPRSSAPSSAISAATPSPDETDAAPPARSVAQPAAADCWRYGQGGWRRLPIALSLSACAEAVFAARCPGEGEAFYGRWGDQTLRLEDGEVGVSDDNQDFRSLVEPWPACESPAR